MEFGNLLKRAYQRTLLGAPGLSSKLLGTRSGLTSLGLRWRCFRLSRVQWPLKENHMRHGHMLRTAPISTAILRARMGGRSRYGLVEFPAPLGRAANSFGHLEDEDCPPTWCHKVSPLPRHSRTLHVARSVRSAFRPWTWNIEHGCFAKIYFLGSFMIPCVC